jgi:hypothetical protein
VYGSNQSSLAFSQEQAEHESRNRGPSDPSSAERLIQPVASASYLIIEDCKTIDERNTSVEFLQRLVSKPVKHGISAEGEFTCLITFFHCPGRWKQIKADTEMALLLSHLELFQELIVIILKILIDQFEDNREMKFFINI